MAAADYISVVQQLYVSYFGRPADYYGLANFTAQLAAIDTAGELTTFPALSAAANAASPTSPLGVLINSFSSSTEATALYGTDMSQIGTSKFVAAIYDNILGREADVEGLTFWVNAILNGTLTRANAAAAITEGALSNTSAQGLLDAQTVANKNTVATNFTAAINTTSEINGYAGDAAAAAARDMLSLVNNTTNTTTFQATVESTLSNIVEGVDAGTTLTLTTGVDTVTGTSKDDTIKALIDDAGANPDLTTLTALDTITGGTGSDTLEITALTAMSTVSGVTVTGVENVSIRAASTVNANFSTWTGVEELTITEAVGAVTLTAAAATNVTSNQKVGTGDATTTINGGKNIVVTQTDVDTTNDDIAVGTTTAAAGTVTVTSTAKNAAHATAALTMGDIVATGGTSIKVTQSAGSAADLTVGAAVTHTQGSVTITGNSSTTSVESYQTAKATAKSGIATVAAVTETASVKFAAMTAGQTLIAGGLTFTAAKDLAAADVAKTFAGLIKGTLPAAGDSQAGGIVANGTYTGTFTGWTSAAASGDTVVFTSTGTGNVADLAFTGTATAPVVTTTTGVAKAGQTAVLGVVNGAVSVVDAAGTIKTATVDGYSTGSTTTTSVLETLNLSNGGAFTVADSAATLALNLSKITANSNLTITAAPATLNVKSTGDNDVNLDANLTETLNVTGTGVFKADTVALGALKTVVVKETAGVTLDATVAATLVTVDSTATTGTTTVSIDSTKATFTGGAGVDDVTTTSATVSKAIATGAGNDSVTLASGTTAVGTGSIAGGDGTDTLSMVAADAVTASGSTAFAGKVTGFERLVATGATGNQEIETDVLGNYNDVEVEAAAGGHVLTLDGMSSGATIRLGDNTNNSTIAKIKNASTGTADVANVILTDDSDDGAPDAKGSVTFADVETVNITTVEGDGADTQNLTLVATKATTIKATGDIALNLTNTGNTSVSLIDASAMTAALTVQAAGTTATTIKGGSGNDVLTASGGTGGGTAQVSTIVLTDGTANTGLDDNDTMSVNVGGTTFTYTATNVETMDAAGAGLAALIDANAAYLATYNAGTNTIEVTAAVAGTPFSLASYAVTDVANDVNKTATAATITDNAVATVQEKHTIAVTADGVDDGDETATVTYDSDGSAGAVTANVVVNLAGIDPTSKAAVTNKIVADLTADAGFSAVATAANVGDDVVVTFKGNDAYANTTIAAGGTTNTLAFATADTANGTAEQATAVVTGTVTGTLNAGDTLAITVDADGAGAGAATTYTYTVAAAAGETLDVAMAGLTALVDAAAGVNAAYNAGTDTLTVTDAVSADANGITISAFTVTDVEVTNATGASAAFATGTGNVTTVGDTLQGGAGADTLVSGTAMSTLTGGDGQDMFVVGGASTNVNSYSTITDFTASDLIQFAGAIGFKSAAVSLGNTAVFQDYANAAMNSLAAGEVGWFQFGTDTYIVMDVGADSTSFTNGTDKIVKLTGAVNLANASFSDTHDTIALI